MCKETISKKRWNPLERNQLLMRIRGELVLGNEAESASLTIRCLFQMMILINCVQ